MAAYRVEITQAGAKELVQGFVRPEENWLLSPIEVHCKPLGCGLVSVFRQEGEQTVHVFNWPS